MQKSTADIAKDPAVFARAKINLTLHIGRVIADPHDPFFGYHPVDSLVVFADIGDMLELRRSDAPSLQITGPFGDALESGPNNLIMQTLQLCGAAPHDVTLTKNLPVSAGIGGGSANAAAVMRYLNITDAELAGQIGADVPVCLLSQTSHMTGIGENVTPLLNMGQLFAVLINPGVAVSTAEIFKRFDQSSAIRETPRPQLASGDLLERALSGRNDLQPIAIEVQPIIADAIGALERQKGCQLARMSGSGATCFGIFETQGQAEIAARTMASNHPDWWVLATLFGEAA